MNAPATITIAFPAPAPATISGATIQTVNARELHAALGVGKDFSTWLKDRIRQYSFSENADFVLLPNSGEYSSRGQPSKDYALSLNMAKELCMVERNEAGKAARRYYIECERRAQQPAPQLADLNDPATLRGLLLAYSDKVDTLEIANAQLAPKADALDRIATAEGSMCITSAAKHLQISRKRLIAGLRKKGWIYKRTPGGPWLGYQKIEERGYVEHKVHRHVKDGFELISEQVRITPAGLARLAENLAHFPKN